MTTTALLISVLAIGLFLSYMARRFGLHKPQRRIVFNSFKLLQSDLNYNEDACLRLLLSEFPVDDAKMAGQLARQNKPYVGKPKVIEGSTNINVSVGGASLPLSFIWDWIRRVVLGEPDVLNFVLSADTEQDLLLEAWRQGDDEYFVGWSNTTNGADKLRTAIESIAEEIRAAYPQYRHELVNQYLYEARFSEAIALIEKILKADSSGKVALSEEEQVSLNSVQAWVLFQSANYSSARQLLESHRTSETQPPYIDSLIALAEYDEALKELNSPMFPIPEYAKQLRTARAFRGKRHIKEAVNAYDQCIAAAADAITSKDKQFDAGWVLVHAHREAAECMLAVNDYFERDNFLHGQQVAARNLREVDSSGDPIHYEALAQEDSGQYQDATDTYRECIEVCKIDQGSSPNDVNILTSLAWAQSGLADVLYQSLRQKLMHTYESEFVHEVMPELIRVGIQLALKGEEERELLIDQLAKDDLSVESMTDLMGDEILDLGLLLDDSVACRRTLVEATECMDVSLQANLIFESLAGRKSKMHRSEGHYGLACVYANLGVEDSVSEELAAGGKIDPSLTEAACWDSDFASIRFDVSNCNTVMAWDQNIDWFVPLDPQPEY